MLNDRCCRPYLTYKRVLRSQPEDVLRAAEEVKKIITTKDIPEGYGLRVGVRGGGCSGMSYVLGFDKLREHDVSFDYEGIPLYIDSAWQKTLFSRAEAVLADQLDYILQPDCSANAHRIGHFPAQTSPFP